MAATKKQSDTSNHGQTVADMNRINQLEFQLKESKQHLKMMREELAELQSTHEKLTTINEEVQRRNEELCTTLNYSRAVIETIKEPLMVLNSDMEVETINKSFLALFRGKTEDFKGRSLYDIFDGQWNILELKDKLKHIVATNKSFEDFEVKHSFGESGDKILLFNAMRLNHNDDKKKMKYLVVIEDFTERRLSEELLKENEERLRLIIQNAFDIITIFSEKGDVIYESESIEEILGYKPADRIHKNIFINTIVHPDDMKKKENMFRNALAHPGKDITSEFRLLHKDGTYRVMEAVCINLLHDFKINGILANYRDITERRALEKQKEQFIGIASHELKTPVTSIKGYVQVLEQVLEEGSNKEALSLLKKMDGQIDRLTNLIKDLLDVTQIGEGILKLKKADFDLNQLVTEVVGEIQPTALKHIIASELQPLPLVSGDKEKIRQVLVNILSNAIKYSPGGRKVEVRSQISDQSVIVSVKDYGIGMSDETQKKIFNRFFRDLDPAMSTFPGLGLGLYIASEILKVHSGNMWVKSSLNEGSEFFFSLPL
jgi:PAS domain S-box-containing protein